MVLLNYIPTTYVESHPHNVCALRGPEGGVNQLDLKAMVLILNYSHLLAELQARISTDCIYLLFLHSNYQVSLRPPTHVPRPDSPLKDIYCISSICSSHQVCNCC